MNKAPKIVTTIEGDRVKYALWQGDNIKVFEWPSERAYFEWWYEAGSPNRWSFPGKDEKAR